MSYDSDVESITSAPVVTKTLLGYIDVEISQEEKLYPNDSFIGGRPVPMDAKSPIPSKYVHCKNCAKPMRLLNQCSADLPGTWYDRKLYVFICIENKCRRKDGSVRAIRGIKKDTKIMEEREEDEKRKIREQELKEKKKMEKEQETKNLVKDLFGSSTAGGENPFASATANPFATSGHGNPFETKKMDKEVSTISEKECMQTYSEAAKTTVQPEPEKKQVVEEYTLPEFKGYILYFETERLDPAKQVLAPLPDNLKIDEDGTVVDESSAGDNIPQGNLPKINPEKNKDSEDIAKLFDDQTFQNFTRVLSYNTQQVLRYEPDGSPILYSSKDTVSQIFYTPEGKFKDKSRWNIPSPTYNPSGHRRFEMQLMPKMIIDLEKDIEDVFNIMDRGMEWGTIIVATDSDDFVPLNWYDNNGVAYLEEWCGVQWEDQVAR